jgi:biopolymer transport protein ExbB
MTQWLEQSWAYWQSGGLLLIPIAVVSLGIWAYFIRTRDHLVRWERQSHRVESMITELDTQSGPADVLNRLSSISGGTAQIICTVMNDVLRGAILSEAFEQREDEGIRALHRDMIILGALTVIAPLLGLLGTVMGMIETFDAVSAVSGETGSRVASGISRALITTQFGLIVALPGVFGVARLRRLLSHIEVRLTECRMQVVALLEQNKGGVAL